LRRRRCCSRSREAPGARNLPHEVKPQLVHYGLVALGALHILRYNWSRMYLASPSEVPTQFWSRFYNLVKDQILVTKTSHQTHWALTHEPSSLTSATHLSRLLFPLVMIRKAVATTTVRRPRGPWFHGLVALFEGWKSNHPARGTTVPVVSGNFQLEIAGWHWSRMYRASPSEVPTQ